MSDEDPMIPMGWDWRTDPAARECLTQIWPIQHPTVFWPVRDMTDWQAESFATAFKRYSDDLATRVGYY